MNKKIVYIALLILAPIVLVGCNKQPENGTIPGDDSPVVQQEITDGQYVVSTGDSSLNWSGAKIIGSSHTGTVDISGGNITIQDGVLTSADFTINMQSIKDADGNESLETHLLGQDFFDVENVDDVKFR